MLDSDLPILRLSFAFAVLFPLAGPAAAQDGGIRELPLMNIESRLPATASEGRKSIEMRDYGVVTINERALALPVEVAGAGMERLRARSDVFDFYFLPLTIGVAGLDGAQVKSFLVEFRLPNHRVTGNDVWIVDVFPRLETAAGRLSADVSVGVSGNLQIETTLPGTPISAGGAKISGQATASWTYNPVFQSFAAVFSEATAIWTFDKVANTIKAGPIDVRLLIAVRKDGRVAEAKALSLTSRIRAEFSGRLFLDRSASTAAKIRVDL